MAHHSAWRLELARTYIEPYAERAPIAVLGGSVAQGVADRWSDTDTIVYWDAIDRDWLETPRAAAARTDALLDPPARQQVKAGRATAGRASSGFSHVGGCASVPYAKRDDLSLFYEQAGDGEPPLVFVHGWCCDHTFFAPQFDHFKASHTVLSLDLRGCGESDQPEGGYDMSSLADDVAWLCGEAGISKPVVLGHSLGGMIAIELAARYPSVPLAIVAVDPGPIHPTAEARRVYAALAAQLEGPDGESVRRTWVENTAAGTADPEWERKIVETMCAAPLSVAAAAIRGVVDWNGVGALAMCWAPLLVLLSRTGGSNDPARLLPIKPDLHIGVTVGGGHFNHLDVPAQVNSMIERFVEIAAT